MTTITQNIDDIAGADDNTSWTFYTQQIRESDAGDAIITTHRVRKYPVAGVLTVVLDPGPAVVIAADGKTYPFTVPATASALWPLIQAAVTIPPSTTHQQLLDAVDAWLASHTNVWASIPDKPAPLAAGANVANGYAGLDGTGKIATAQLPISAMEYKGLWNASTNSPTLADGTGNSGDFYRVGTAGSRNLGSGSITFDVGDYVLYNGSTWEKLDATDAVTSVAGLAGAITSAALRTSLGVAGGVSIAQFGATTGSADNHTAIVAAIAAVSSAGGGEVFVPTGTWITAPFSLPSRVTLVGEGATSSYLKLKNTSNAHFITLATANTLWVGLRDIGIDGNGANQSAGDVIHWDNTGFTGTGFVDGDAYHFVTRVVITGGKARGFVHDVTSGGRGALQLTNVLAYSNGGDGFYINSPDNQFDHCMAAANGGNGFNLDSGTQQNRLLGCKSFFNGLTDGSGSGFQVLGSRNDLIHVEAQDNCNAGFVMVNTADCILIGKSERNGLGPSPYTAGGLGDGIFASGVTNCRIILNLTDRNSGGLKQRFGYSCGSGNNGNIVDLTIGAMQSTLPGTGSWGANSVVTIIYNSGTPTVQAPVSDATATALALKAPLASPTFTGTVSGITKTMVGLGSVDNTADTAKPVSTAQQTALNLKADKTETVNTVTTSGSAQTIPDPATGASMSLITLTANCTFTFPTAAAGKSLSMGTKQDGTGSRTVTWPAAVHWPGGVAPTLTTAANKIDRFAFYCDDGSTWTGCVAGQNYS